MKLYVDQVLRKVRTKIWRLVSHFMTDQVFLRIKYFIWFNHWPDLKKPKLYSEKIIWRMLYDHKPLFQQISDKVALRDYVKEKGLERYLPLQYYVTDDPTSINIETLPNTFVLKPSHASGRIHTVYEKEKENWDEIIELCNDWLKVDYYRRGREWQYKDIPRKIIVEEFLGKGKTTSPEYNFHCFDGEPKMIVVVLGRFTPQFRKGRFDLDWSPWVQDNFQKGAMNFPRPDQLDELIEAARLLSSGLDYVRVDLYLLPERIVLGELTLTSSAGMSKLTTEVQLFLGDQWNLNINTGKLINQVQ